MENKKPPQRYPHTKESVKREMYRAGVNLEIAEDRFKDAKWELAGAERRMAAAKELKVGDSH